MAISRVRRAAWSIAALAALSVLILVFVQPGLAQSGVTRVWAVDDGEKVRRDDLNHWAASSPDNAVWDGTTIRLFGARNEIVAFQLILEARTSGATDVDVRLDSLEGPGYVIANHSATDDPFDYRGRHIERFLEHYINVTQRSASGNVSCWVDARPIPDADFLGWIPDALIPFQATPGTAAQGVCARAELSESVQPEHNDSIRAAGAVDCRAEGVRHSRPERCRAGERRGGSRLS